MFPIREWGFDSPSGHHHLQAVALRFAAATAELEGVVFWPGEDRQNDGHARDRRDNDQPPKQEGRAHRVYLPWAPGAW